MQRLYTTRTALTTNNSHDKRIRSCYNDSMQQPQPIMKFLLIGLLIIFGFYGGDILADKLYPDSDKETSSEIRIPDDSEGIVSLTAEQVQEMLAASGKPSLLFLYASWCPYCRQQFKVFDAMGAEYKDSVQILYVSIDSSLADLQTFLKEEGHAGRYTPYHLPPEGGGFREWFGELKVPFTGGIPFTILFDEKGKLIASYSGLTQKDEFDRGLEPLIVR